MKKMIFWTGIVLHLVLATQAVFAADKIRAASGGFGTAINAIVPAAYHQGVFKKYGLDVEYIALDSGTLGMQTLLANEIQFLFTTGALPVTSGAGPDPGILEAPGAERPGGDQEERICRESEVAGDSVCPKTALE